MLPEAVCSLSLRGTLSAPPVSQIDIAVYNFGAILHFETLRDVTPNYLRIYLNIINFIL